MPQQFHRLGLEFIEGLGAIYIPAVHRTQKIHQFAAEESDGVEPVGNGVMRERFEFLIKRRHLLYQMGDILLPNAFGRDRFGGPLRLAFPEEKFFLFLYGFAVGCDDILPSAVHRLNQYLAGSIGQQDGGEHLRRFVMDIGVGVDRADVLSKVVDPEATMPVTRRARRHWSTNRCCLSDEAGGEYSCKYRKAGIVQ